MAVESARVVLVDYADEPREVCETDDGYVVLGSTHGVSMVDGSLGVEALEVANDYGALAQDILGAVKGAQAAQARFLATKGLTIEQARKLPKAKQAALQREYTEWLKTNEAALDEIDPAFHKRGQDRSQARLGKVQLKPTSTSSAPPEYLSAKNPQTKGKKGDEFAVHYGGKSIGTIRFDGSVWSSVDTAGKSVTAREGWSLRNSLVQLLGRALGDAWGSTPEAVEVSVEVFEAKAPGKLIPIDDPVYVDKIKYPKYNVAISPLSAHGSDTGKLLASRLPGWTKDDHEKAADAHEKEAERLTKEWGDTAEKAAKATWGRSYQMTDYRISGIASDEFADKFKDALRAAASGSSRHKDAAFAHKAAAKLRRTPRGESVGDVQEDDETTVVVFRRFPEADGGDVIALFPRIPEGPGLIASYQHVGQHGAASRTLLTRGTSPARETDPDVAALHKELTRIGYKLKVSRASAVKEAFASGGQLQALFTAAQKGKDTKALAAELTRKGYASEVRIVLRVAREDGTWDDVLDALATEEGIEEVLEPKNTDYGFWGTIASQPSKELADKAWAEALPKVQRAFKLKPEEARAVLDSKIGRHMADAWLNGDFDNYFNSPSGMLKKSVAEIVKAYHEDPKAFYNESSMAYPTPSSEFPIYTQFSFDLSDLILLPESGKSQLPYDLIEGVRRYIDTAPAVMRERRELARRVRVALSKDERFQALLTDNGLQMKSRYDESVDESTDQYDYGFGLVEDRLSAAGTSPHQPLQPNGFSPMKPNEAADLVLGDGVVELRSTDSDHVYVQVECDADDPASVAAAVEEVTTAAVEEGFAEVDETAEGDALEGEVFDEFEAEFIEDLATDLADLASEGDADAVLPDIRLFDEAVEETDYEAAVARAEAIVKSLGEAALTEFKRRRGRALSTFRRSLKLQTPAEKMRNRKARRAYKTNPAMRRRAKMYRKKFKRFLRNSTGKASNLGESRDPTKVGPTTKAEAQMLKRKGYAFAVWSDESDVQFFKTRGAAEDHSKGDRTWTGIDELIGVLEDVVSPDDVEVIEINHQLPAHMEENYASDAHQKAFAGKAGTDDALHHAAVGFFGGTQGQAHTFAGLSASMQAAGYTGVTGATDTQMMSILGRLVHEGALRYVPSKGFTAVAEAFTEEAFAEATSRVASQGREGDSPAARFVRARRAQKADSRGKKDARRAALLRRARGESLDGDSDVLAETDDESSDPGRVVIRRATDVEGTQGREVVVIWPGNAEATLKGSTGSTRNFVSDDEVNADAKIDALVATARQIAAGVAPS
jgi:hypothetical protein